MYRQTIQIPMAGSFGLRHMHKINWDGPASATYVAFLRQKDSASKFFAASTVVDCDYDIFESKILEVRVMTLFNVAYIKESVNYFSLKTG